MIIMEYLYGYQGIPKKLSAQIQFNSKYTHIHAENVSIYDEQIRKLMV